MYNVLSKFVLLFPYFKAPRRKKTTKRKTAKSGEESNASQDEGESSLSPRLTPDQKSLLSPFGSRKNRGRPTGSSSDEDHPPERGRRTPRSKSRERVKSPVFTATRSQGRSRSRSPMPGNKNSENDTPDGSK